MQGFDPDSKLGASARTEQIFGSISVLAVLSTYALTLCELARKFLSMRSFMLEPRKGIDCSKHIIDGLLDGMPFADSDRVFWIDVIANEQRICNQTYGLGIMHADCFV